MTTLLIRFGRVTGYTKARGFNVETAKKLLLVSLFYNANVAFALASLKGVNIPMYIAIKRLTPLAVLIAGLFYGKGRPTTQVCIFYLYFLFVRLLCRKLLFCCFLVSIACIFKLYQQVIYRNIVVWNSFGRFYCMVCYHGKIEAEIDQSTIIYNCHTQSNIHVCPATNAIFSNNWCGTWILVVGVTDIWVNVFCFWNGELFLTSKKLESSRSISTGTWTNYPSWN